MRDAIIRAGGGAAVGFTAAALIYPHGMQFGGTIIDSEWVKILLPVVVAIVSAVWPQGGAILKKILDFLRDRKVLQSQGIEDVTAPLTQALNWFAARDCEKGVDACCNALKCAAHQHNHRKDEHAPTPAA